MLKAFYFSPSGTTKETVSLLTNAIDGDSSLHDMTLNGDEQTFKINPDDIVLVGCPVYAGRIPPIALERMAQLKGNGQKAIAVGVYGNRDYDDAILELSEFLSNKGFDVIAAGAFIGQHCIFPKVATNRPDAEDKEKISQFAEEIKASINNNLSLDLSKIKGNHPYKKITGVPLNPITDKKKCSGCGTCADECPTRSIDPDNPTKTDSTTCITCCRCINICQQKARRLGGLLYKIAGRKFVKDNTRRLEPEWFI